MARYAWPRFCAEIWMQDRADCAQWPFNRALRELGATRAAAFDEFDAIGLGEYRFTADWLERG